MKGIPRMKDISLVDWLVFGYPNYKFLISVTLELCRGQVEDWIYNFSVKNVFLNYQPL